MYFVWRKNHHGLIRVSCEGISAFVDDVLKSKLRLYSVTLSPSQEDADLTIVISDEDIKSELKQQVESHFIEALKPMGLKALIVWASPEREFVPLLHSPYAWAVIASCFTVILTAGFESFFWTAFWGASAWFAVHGLEMLAKKFRNADNK